MKKLFLLIPALVLAISARTAVIEVYPTTPNFTDNIRRAVRDNASAGDIIMLMSDADAYVESSDYMLLDKNVTIMAAEGKHPVIKMNQFAKLLNSATVKFIGIKFDGSDAADASKGRCLRPYDTTTGKIVKFENCEFYGFKSHVIYCSAEYNLDSCIINNCYFHDNAMNAVYFYKSSDASVQTAKGVIIKNSTFTNRGPGEAGSVIEVRNQGTEPIVEDVELTVDHCTFYNNTFGDGDYSPIRSHKLGKMTVTNCIFAHPDAYAKYAVYAYGGSVSNCLTYNLTSGFKDWSPCPTFTDNITADPLFTDAANGDYSFAGNWVTMELSPARGAATDGSDLGDPRWYTAPTLPSTNFATPYVFTGDKAVLSGNIWYDGTNDYLYGDGGSNKDYGTAKWKIHAEKACVVEVAVNLNSGNASGHKLRVEVLDADGNSIGEFAEEASTLPGTLSIPAVGSYTIILHDDQTWSSAKIDNITLTYIGGEVQIMPGTTNLADAWFSSNGTRTSGAIEYSSIGSGCWAKWNISVANTAWYNVTANIKGQYGHDITVEFFEAGNPTPVATAAEGSTVYDNDLTSYPAALGLVQLEAGEYEMKFSNAVGDAALISIALAYVGGAVQNLPGTADINDAWFSSNGTRTSGAIEYTSIGSGCWAKWNVAVANAGTYNVFVDIRGQYGHNFTVEFLKEGSSTPLSLSEGGTVYDNDLTLYHAEIGAIELEAANYVMTISNAVGDAAFLGAQVSYAGGGIVNIPGTIPFSDAALSTNAYVDAGNLYFTDYDHRGHISNENARWNVHATEGLYNFIANCNGTEGWSHLKMTITDSESHVVFSQQTEWSYSGEKEVKFQNIFLEAGDYEIQLENPADWSHGYLTGFSAAIVENVIVIDENVENMDLLVTENGNGRKALLKRSFKGGMYNTICVPFNVSSSSELESIFGTGYELLEMTSATLDGSVLDLNFAVPASNIEYGRPYLIKPTQDVKNPLFNSHTIYKSTSHLTVSGTGANFIGTLMKKTIAASTDNLYLQAHNMLEYSQDAVTIKGTRAYFHVNVSGMAPIVRPRIVLNGQVLTDIELVDGEPQTNGKFIENGQLIILRDGVRYNALGTRVK